MKLIKSYHIELSESEKDVLLKNANELNHRVSVVQYIQYIECLLTQAASMTEHDKPIN